MIKLISKADGKTAVTLLILCAFLLLAIFMIPLVRVEASHCDNTAVDPCTEKVFDTKHNLNANTDIGPVGGTTEICIFCHTPHGAKTGGGILGGKSSPTDATPAAQAPLWNRRINVGTNYSIYSGPNFDAQGTTPGQPKGVSLACLSCHDGAISFDALVNPPGSGGFIPNNRDQEGVNGATDRIGWTFGGAGVDATGSMKEGNRGLQNTGAFGSGQFVNPTGTQGMEPYPNLTTDLRDDHPISMQMPSTDPQFADVLSNRAANVDGGATNDGIKISFVSRYGTGDQTSGSSGDTRWSTDKRDRLRLYPTVTNDPSQYVECASCHNPHTQRPLFLRLPTVSRTSFAGNNFTGGGFGTTLMTGNPNGDLSDDPNQGSLVCLSCHQK